MSGRYWANVREFHVLWTPLHRIFLPQICDVFSKYLNLYHKPIKSTFFSAFYIPRHPTTKLRKTDRTIFTSGYLFPVPRRRMGIRDIAPHILNPTSRCSCVFSFTSGRLYSPRCLQDTMLAGSASERVRGRDICLCRHQAPLMKPVAQSL